MDATACFQQEILRSKLSLRSALENSITFSDSCTVIWNKAHLAFEKVLCTYRVSWHNKILQSGMCTDMNLDLTIISFRIPAIRNYETEEKQGIFTKKDSTDEHPLIATAPATTVTNVVLKSLSSSNIIEDTNKAKKAQTTQAQTGTSADPILSYLQHHDSHVIRVICCIICFILYYEIFCGSSC